MKTRGWGPFREDWYSICSAPPGHDPDCSRCASGRWINRWRNAASGVVFKLCPRLWIWWVNRGG